MSDEEKDSDAGPEAGNGVMAGTLSALQEVPGTLETTAIPNIPTIAGQQQRAAANSGQAGR